MKTFDKLFLPKSLFDYFKEEIKSVGIEKELHQILKKLLIVSFVISLISFFFRKIPDFPNFLELILYVISSFLIIYFVAFFVVLIFFYIWLSVKKYNRKNKIESVLADYLQLVSTNVSSGMTIDQALWYAVRKRFGILSYEVEIVAKKIMGGVEVDVALIDFAEKYDSDILKKSVALLVEGMKSGGKLGGLISKISWNIKENQLMKKQLASDTTVYVMFIGFSTLIAAPILFALSHRIIIVMTDIMSQIDLSSAVGVSTKMPITELGSGLDQSDFKIFAYLSMFVTSVFSSLIIGSVRSGNIKGGVKLIPIFVLISFVLFLLASVILTHFFSGIGF